MLMANLTALSTPADPKEPDFSSLVIIGLLIMLAGYTLRGILWLLTH